jgi:hypothetical protein
MDEIELPNQYPQTNLPESNSILPPKIPNKPWVFPLVISLSLAIGVIGAFTYLYLGKHQASNETIEIDIAKPEVPTESSSTTKPTPKKASESSKTFTSALGFSFSYPSAWGEASEQITDLGNDESRGVSGKTYLLAFSNARKPEFVGKIAVGYGNSSDFTAARGGTEADFLGYKDKPKGITTLVWTDHIACSWPMSATIYSGKIEFNLPGKEISGVRLIMPLLSETDQEIMHTKNIEMDEPAMEAYCLDDNINRDATDYLKELKSEKLDEVSKQQAVIFEQIMESAKVF